jgi:DUF218 domain
MAVAIVACREERLDLQSVHDPLDVVLVPGCPSLDDGELSVCQWQRAIWGAHLWQIGVARHVIASGNAVHSPYVEAEALAAGMVAMGVPRRAIYTETQALHSDENGAYTLAMMATLHLDTIGVASQAGQADGIRKMLVGWGHPAESLPMDEAFVAARMAEGLPDVRTDRVPAWLPLRQRRKVLRAQTGHGRPPSWWVYTWMPIARWLGTLELPVPPQPEPTLHADRVGAGEDDAVPAIP